MAGTLITIAAFVVALGIGWAIHDLVTHIQDMNERITKLEKAQPKHLNYERLEQIEAAASAILALKRESDLYQDFIDNALTHIGRAREDKRK